MHNTADEGVIGSKPPPSARPPTPSGQGEPLWNGSKATASCTTTLSQVQQQQSRGACDCVRHPRFSLGEAVGAVVLFPDARDAGR